MTRKNRIMIYGPKDDGTYLVEFRTAEGDVLAISIPRTESAVLRHFQDLSWPRSAADAARARRTPPATPPAKPRTKVMIADIMSFCECGGAK
jgi:hypothetical protein